VPTGKTVPRRSWSRSTTRQQIRWLASAGSSSSYGERRRVCRSAIGKARGLVLRLSLVLEYLRWCSEDSYAASPTIITEDALLAAVAFVTDYIIPSAQRAYGNATCSGDGP
jgi:hypothetical protein